MSEIRAIEAEYNGFKFRSRLEARWAIFFDAASIEYRYEPEGFELSGGRYLPDFYLPDYGVYVEIKPFDRSVVKYSGDCNKWEKKCSEFRTETGKAIILCYDDPSYDIRKQLFAWDACDSGGGEYDSDATFKCFSNTVYIVSCDSRSDRSLFVTGSYDNNRRVITGADWVRLNMAEIVSNEMSEKFNFSAGDFLNLAKKEARQARFEFGQTPTKEQVQGRMQR